MTSVMLYMSPIHYGVSFQNSVLRVAVCILYPTELNLRVISRIHRTCTPTITITSTQATNYYIQLYTINYNYMYKYIHDNHLEYILHHVVGQIHRLLQCF